MQQKLSEDKKNLVSEHMGLAKSIAAKICKRYDIGSETRDDIFSTAYLGLTEAAMRYDFRQGVAFSSFAYHRIQGSILDGLRKKPIMGPQKKPRLLNDYVTNDYLQNQSAAEAALPRALSMEEGIQRIGDHIADLVTITQVSLDVETLYDHEALCDDDPLSELEKKEERRAVAEAIKNLPKRERKLLEIIYFKKKSFKEAGESLGLSRSWVSRVHVNGIRLIRKHFQRQGEILKTPS